MVLHTYLQWLRRYPVKDCCPPFLLQVFQIIGEEPEWIRYDRWGTYFPEGNFAAAVGATDFLQSRKNENARYGRRFVLSRVWHH